MGAYGDMIRRATVDDIPRLVQMGREFFDMTDLGQITEYDEQSAEQTLYTLITGESSVVLVAEVDNTAIGATGAIIAPFYFNAAHRVAQEFFWFVSAAYRNGSVGARLFNALEKWAKESGANSMSMVALRYNHESVGAFYRLKGYYQQETSFMRRI